MPAPARGAPRRDAGLLRAAFLLIPLFALVSPAPPLRCEDSFYLSVLLNGEKKGDVLARRCPRCATLRPPSDRFCSECGHDLSVPADAVAERLGSPYSYTPQNLAEKIINGRNAIPWDDRLRLDVWYVDHCSLWLDCRILCRTVAQVLLRRGISADGHVTMPEFTGSKEPPEPRGTIEGDAP